MTFQVRIQNLGKLADATVRVAPLTCWRGRTTREEFLLQVPLLSAGHGESQSRCVARAGFTGTILHCLNSVEYVLAPWEFRDKSLGFVELIAMVRQVEKMSASLGLGDAPLSKSHPDFTRLVGMAVAKYVKLPRRLSKRQMRRGLLALYPKLTTSA